MSRPWIVGSQVKAEGPVFLNTKQNQRPFTSLAESVQHKIYQMTRSRPLEDDDPDGIDVATQCLCQLLACVLKCTQDQMDKRMEAAKKEYEAKLTNAVKQLMKVKIPEAIEAKVQRLDGAVEAVDDVKELIETLELQVLGCECKLLLQSQRHEELVERMRDENERTDEMVNDAEKAIAALRERVQVLEVASRKMENRFDTSREPHEIEQFDMQGDIDEKDKKRRQLRSRIDALEKKAEDQKKTNREMEYKFYELEDDQELRDRDSAYLEEEQEEINKKVESRLDELESQHVAYEQRLRDLEDKLRDMAVSGG